MEHYIAPPLGNGSAGGGPITAGTDQVGSSENFYSEKLRPSYVMGCNQMFSAEDLGVHKRARAH